jgi:hypothetical protein
MHASFPIAIVRAVEGRNSIKTEVKNNTQEINLNRVYQALIPIEK